jgi:hypothetical protein
VGAGVVGTGVSLGVGAGVSIGVTGGDITTIMLELPLE